MKNCPPSGAVEYWSDWMMLAPQPAGQPATAATMPCRSGHVISSRAIRTRQSRSGESGKVLRAAQRRERVPVHLALDRAERRAALGGERTDALERRVQHVLGVGGLVDEPRGGRVR